MLPLGTVAPDFSLHVLKMVKTKDGSAKGTITKEKVHLGALRGKKVACLFFSSYT